MKIERKLSKIEFVPIVITLETKDELCVLKNVLYNSSIRNQWGLHYDTGIVGTLYSALLKASND